ncbi:MAG TPA: aminotransferase class IV [Solirubrobacter sp.]|nr:aminotransferase class IV [Solirubrobacter sp.]
MLASVDGVIGPATEARIPILDEGLLRGDGAFEATRLYAGRPFALEDHYARLRRSCAGVRLDVDFDALRAEVAALVERTGTIDAVLRIVVTRGGRRIALVEPLPKRAAAARVMTVRYAPSRVLDGLKTLSYAGNMLASRLAKEAGYDEALLVSPHRRVLEGPTSSFFWVRDGELLTPPLSDRILASITRARVVAAMGAVEEPCALEDLQAAEEAFLASSVREVQPVAAIDDLRLPAAPGPVTERAREALMEAIERELGAAA